MSLYGSLFSGVAGLQGQSTRIGVISDNIANVNTIGYKGNNLQFETLVASLSSSTSFNPGGVLSNVVSRNDVQGLLQGTDNVTDLAISGNGFFVVNGASDSTSDVLFTRAGDFTIDEQGNLVNSAGFFLQGWPLDQSGRRPGEPGNANTTPSSSIDSLSTVNIESSSGEASATNAISVGANLDATQSILQGSGDIIDFVSTFNEDIDGNDVIVPTTGGTEDMLEDDTLTISSDGITYEFVYGGFEGSSDVTTIDFSGVGGGLTGVDIASTTENFFVNGAGPTGTTAEFYINTTATGTVTFTYTEGTPNAFQGEFNDLESLTAAIDAVSGLSARIVGSGGASQLYVAPDDADQTMTFTSGAVGTVDWATIFGLADTAADPTPRFASLSDLVNKINSEEGITATIENELGDAQVSIFTDNPLASITFGSLSGTANADEMALQLGLNDGTSTVDFTFDAIYDATDSTRNMASGAISPQFSITRTVFDSLGAPHNITLGYIKVAENTWATEIYTEDGDSNNQSAGGLNQVASGTVVFNGDSTLRSVSQGLLADVTVNWTNGAVASALSFDFGTAGQPSGTTNATVIGLADGLSQNASGFNVAFFDQNGSEVGSLTGVTVDEEGRVFANFSNGSSEALYQIPIADFSSPNNLDAKSGNVFAANEAAGELNLREAGQSGVGSVVSGAIENSNVELADELTNLIIAQRSYQASSQVISTADELLEELVRL